MVHIFYEQFNEIEEWYIDCMNKLMNQKIMVHILYEQVNELEDNICIKKLMKQKNGSYIV